MIVYACNIEPDDGRDWWVHHITVDEAKATEWRAEKPFTRSVTLYELEDWTESPSPTTQESSPVETGTKAVYGTGEDREYQGGPTQ